MNIVYQTEIQDYRYIIIIEMRVVKASTVTEATTSKAIVTIIIILDLRLTYLKVFKPFTLVAKKMRTNKKKEKKI